MSDPMPIVWILAERTEGGWVCTARDDVGDLTSVRSNLRTEAVKRCQFAAARLMGTACRFEVQEMNSGEHL